MTSLSSPSFTAAEPLPRHVDPALTRAVVRGDLPVVERLLREGADPDVPVPDLDGPDGTARTGSLLDLAWANVGLDDRHGDTIMALLIGHGADLRRCHPHTWWQVCSDRLETIFEPFVRAGSAGLMASTDRDHPLAKLFEDLPNPLPDSWVTLMLENGLDPHHRIEGMTVLGLAARVQDANLVQRLIAVGANPEDVDDEHQTLLEASMMIAPEACQVEGHARIAQLWNGYQRSTLRQAMDGLEVAEAARPRVRL